MLPSVLQLIRRVGVAVVKKEPKIMDNKTGGVVVVGEHVYGVTDGGKLKCVELKTGKVVWEDRCVGAKASLAYADGNFVVRSEGGKGTGTRYDLLTDREREVLNLLADGFSSKDLAAKLNLSVKTVDAHKYNLMKKLDIHNRADLVKYAIRKKLVHVSVIDGAS